MRIPCPHCGARDEAEFTYRGDATVTRPGPDAGIDDFHDYLYLRANPRGWQVEWWQHHAGCRAFLKVTRHTVTHEIRAVETPSP
ncbi:MAG TPA: sarcosine oxidase subunit delta [Roseomonas sp.]|nr:sarcosine oxidase subunit delta [Roseomonas sp.]